MIFTCNLKDSIENCSDEVWSKEDLLSVATRVIYNYEREVLLGSGGP